MKRTLELTADEQQQTRMTRQRREILACFHKSGGMHQTADDVYADVRQRIPNISLGTVYRNLELLSAAGQIRKLELAGTQRQYDGSTTPHDHVRCEVCGRIDDVQWRAAGPARRSEWEDVVTDYEITGCRVEFTGVCPRCVRSGRD